MKNEIKNIEELKGKTIANIKLDCGDLWLKFTDNTFTVLVVEDITEEIGFNQNGINIRQEREDDIDHMLVELDIISEEEYDKIHKQELRDEEKRNEKWIESLRRDAIRKLEMIKIEYGLNN